MKIIEPRKSADISRRRFIAGAGKVMTSLAMPVIFSNCRTLPKNSTMPIPQISIQLWTLREAMEKDLSGTLERIAAIGYPSVETAFFPEGISISRASQLLERAGLFVCAVHCEIPIGAEQERILEMTEAYRCNRIVWHGWPEDERYQTVEGTLELVAIYNDANQFAKTNGLQFGLHNHWWEFERQANGRYAYTDLLENLDDDIFFEIDTYWVKVAGLDPAEIVGDLGHRAPLLHIKDGPATFRKGLDQDKPDPMVAAGKGTQDFPAIAAAGNGHTKYMIVELDECATDMFAAVEESFKFLTSNGLAGG